MGFLSLIRVLVSDPDEGVLQSQELPAEVGVLMVEVGMVGVIPQM